MENISQYFDYAATSPSDPEILREALEISIEAYGNPSSIHGEGVKARKILEEARERCGKVLGVKGNQLFFTSGGTESDHLPLLSILRKPEKGRIIISGIEHPALREECENLRKIGYDVVTVNPDKNGFISPNIIEENITSNTLFITVMAVNNETGCVQPIYEIADRITEATKGKRRPHFHVDCVQAAGKIPLDISHAGIDSAAFSGHKIAGPRGIGLLYIAKPSSFQSFLVGGGQEQNVRSGTENLFGAVAFSKCLEKYFLKEEAVSQRKLTSDFIKELSSINNCVLVPEIRGDLSEENQGRFSPFVVQAAFKGIPGQVMVRALDAKGFSISTGSACSAKKQSRPILEAMKVSRDLQDSAVRFSFGAFTTEDGMKKLVQAVKEVCSDFN